MWCVLRFPEGRYALALEQSPVPSVGPTSAESQERPEARVLVWFHPSLSVRLSAGHWCFWADVCEKEKQHFHRKPVAGIEREGQENALESSIV